MKRAFIRRQQKTHSQSGMSLIELMIATIVLAVGFAGLLIMIMNSIATNGRNSRDSTGTILAQQVLEQISTQPANSSGTLTMSDCASPANNFTVALAPGGSPVANGRIDFAQAKVNNYHMDFVVCGTNGRQATYDVRWNVTTLDTYTAIVTVSARPATLGSVILSPMPVTLRSIIGS
jgi:prepilin-type N-terminal cleavage/methylation domain-containing protein